MLEENIIDGLVAVLSHVEGSGDNDGAFCEDAATMAIKTLCVVAMELEVRKYIINECDVVGHLIAIMDQKIENAELQSAGCKIFHLLCLDSTGLEAACQESSIRVILQALEVYAHVTELVADACGLGALASLMIQLDDPYIGDVVDDAIELWSRPCSTMRTTRCRRRRPLPSACSCCRRAPRATTRRSCSRSRRRSTPSQTPFM